ncbi:MAG: hypothetical protein NZM65_07365 [Flavobacteriales bacterium]|nr:hypothetical protein [Flavobacteriales bacterium]MDW8410491.1 hypothetical protein [Flavobacteriales bacterium]
MVAGFFLAAHSSLLISRIGKTLSESDIFPWVKLLAASVGSCFLILLLGWYQSSFIILNTDHNHKVPYWWTVSLGLSLPLPVLSHLSWSGPLLALILAWMGYSILSGYDQPLSPRRFFFIGVLAGLPWLGKFSPVLLLPLAFVLLYIVYPFSFNSFITVLLGYLVTELWIWVLTSFWGATVGELDFRLGNGQWWFSEELSNVWLCVILGCAIAGFLLLLNQGLKFKVFHRRMISCLFTLLAFVPWFITCLMSLADVVWCIIPFLGIPVWASFRFLPTKASLALFFFVNIVMIITNIADM